MGIKLGKLLKGVVGVATSILPFGGGVKTLLKLGAKAIPGADKVLEDIFSETEAIYRERADIREAYLEEIKEQNKFYIESEGRYSELRTKAEGIIRTMTRPFLTIFFSVNFVIMIYIKKPIPDMFGVITLTLIGSWATTKALRDYKRQRVIGTMEKSITNKLMPKCLLMIPERLAWSLIQNGWILRNKIVWYKPNAMPSSVTDRFSNRWEYMFLFSKGQRYYFDLDAVRENIVSQSKTKILQPYDSKYNEAEQTNPKSLSERRQYFRSLGLPEGHPLVKNPGDVFEINTQPFPEAHFAVFPEKLCEKPIKAGCPEEVCKKCGKARERIVEKEVEFISGSGKAGNPPKGKHEHSVQSKSGSYDIRMGPQVSTKTIGWTSCKCNAGVEGGIVLDPFCGAGTALLVAKEMRRRFIGIDIKQEYCDMCEERLAQGVL